MNNIVLNITQGFQLAALLPAVLVIFYLLATTKNFARIILPVFYFYCLAASFMVPLFELVPDGEYKYFLRTILVFSKNCIPAASFLLIMQFLTGTLPPPLYFAILAVPVIGGGAFSYLYLNFNEVCTQDNNCISSSYLMNLYHVISSSFIFLLLTMIISRKSAKIDDKDSNREAKYWLIITLVLFNVITISTHLAEVLKWIDNPDASFIRTMIGVAFMYMALSSIFRVFTTTFQVAGIEIWKPSAMHYSLAAAIEKALKENNAYRQVGLSRKKLAQQLKVNEQTLSKVINWKFQKSFRELTNELRIEEAKKQLAETDKPVSMISFDVGFTSITSFNRVFKEHTGKSATSFRSHTQQSSRKAS